jgi:hypothetical protein
VGLASIEYAAVTNSRKDGVDEEKGLPNTVGYDLRRMRHGRS